MMWPDTYASTHKPLSCFTHDISIPPSWHILTRMWPLPQTDWISTVPRPSLHRGANALSLFHVSWSSLNNNKLYPVRPDQWRPAEGFPRLSVCDSPCAGETVAIEKVFRSRSNLVLVRNLFNSFAWSHASDENIGHIIEEAKENSFPTQCTTQTLHLKTWILYR